MRKKASDAAAAFGWRVRKGVEMLQSSGAA
jgi:hypothetical protein